MTSAETKKFIDEHKKLEQSLAKKITEIDEKKTEEEVMRQANIERQEKVRELRDTYLDLGREKVELHN